MAISTDLMIRIAKLSPQTGRALHLANPRLTPNLTPEDRQSWYVRIDKAGRSLIPTRYGLRLHTLATHHQYNPNTDWPYTDYILETAGTMITFAFGYCHSFNDQPAIIQADGSRRWYRHGRLHRDTFDKSVDQPAIIWASDTKEWWKNGQPHRDGDKPAVIRSTGTNLWYKNGKFHRDGDLPAVIEWTGAKTWFKDGRIHRDGDLPAVITSDGICAWYKDGKSYVPSAAG